MARTQKNSALQKAKREKNDEFYTQLEDIELEMSHYRQHFIGKTIFCNCDDPTWSNFWRYFHVNFADLRLARLISTHYDSNGKPSYMMEYTGGNDLDVSAGAVTTLRGDGDFRSEECITLLEQADIVVTNPPFSLFREYVAQLMEYDKKFIIIGNQNSITCKEIFPLIKSDKLWYGASIHSGDRKFGVPDSYPLDAAGCGIDEKGQRYIRVKGVRWYTNLDITKRHEPFFDPESVHAQYVGNEDTYPMYDNYAAIEVGRTKDIPEDYFGIMGVPITFLDKYNPDDFEIVGASEQCGKGFSGDLYDANSCVAHPMVNGQKLYSRLFIKRKIQKGDCE